MGRRKSRRRKPGRRVYYKTWSHGQAQRAPSKQDMYREFNGTARVMSPASMGARELREQRLLEKAIKVIGLSDTAEHAEVLEKLRSLRTIENMDRHVVVHSSLARVRILLHNKEKTQFWFVERDKLTNQVKCSIMYGSWSLAYGMHQVNAVIFKKN